MSHPVVKRYLGRRRQLRKKVTDPDNARYSMSVPDGYERATIEVEVDFDKLCQLYDCKAMGTKRGISKLCNGAVILRVRDRQRESA